MRTKSLTISSLMIIGCFAHAEPVAVLDTAQPQPPGETRVWSPLFQASWDKMNSLHQGKPTKVVPKNPLVHALNTRKWNKEKVLPPNGYAVFAGPATIEFEKSVAERVKKQFRLQMTPSTIPVSQNTTALYSFLVRDLEFKLQFYRSQKKPMRFLDGLGKIHQVPFFGTAGAYSERYGNNVNILRYDHANKNFIMTVCTKTYGERIILYKPEQASSFETAIDYVLKAKQAPLAGPRGSLTDSRLHKKDAVMIPYLHFKLKTDFSSQLQGSRFYEGDNIPYQVTTAYQITHLDLHEKGARIRVENHHDDAPFGDIAPKPAKQINIPRQFICDRPFFIFAWRDNADLPYFAAWIDGKDALLPFRP